MVDRKSPIRILRHIGGVRWRFTAALLLSIVVHLSIFLAWAPEYAEVRDVAVEFELVDGDAQQPLAPEAEGPRSLSPENTNISEEEAIAEEDAPHQEKRGTLTGDTDAAVKKKKDTDSAMDTATSADTGIDTIADKDTEVDSEVDSESDTASEAKNPTDTDTINDTQSDQTEDSDSETEDTEDAEQPAARLASGMDSDTGKDSDSETGAGVAAAAAGTETDSDTKENQFPESTGAAKGTASEDSICLHDLFAFAKPNPTWMAWLSMQAFAGTRYEQGLASILKSFYLYSEMVDPAEIDPMTELEGVLLSADDFSQFNTYQVVATYNVGQGILQNRLQKNMETAPEFTLKETPQGISGVDAGSYRWDLVGSGRVLVASDAQKGMLNPDWPQKVTCMMARAPFTGNARKHFEALVRSKLGPQKKGDRWPVMMLATRDPGAAGLYYKPALAEQFEWAILKGYFSEPIQLVGEVKFKEAPNIMKSVESEVTQLLTKASYLRYLGFKNVVDNLEYRVENNTLHFTVPMTKEQADVLFQLILRYSHQLNAKFVRP